MKKEIDVYEIYEDNHEVYPPERYEMATGTLEDVHKCFCEWLTEHIEEDWEYETEEEWFAEHDENVKLFVDSPKQWVEKHGVYAEIYSDWMLEHKCTINV